MELRAGVASDRGLVRQTNEDYYLLRRGLYAVCDGMGGARAGEVASETACRELLSLDPTSAGPDELRAAISRANEAIIRLSFAEENLSGMGTTLTAALVGESTLSLAHVGDSRAYLLHGGRLTQLTDDHSWVGEMVRRGELSPAQAAVHPHRSVITRALGTETDADPDIFEVPLEPGDRVLLCSDGLTGMVSDSEIAGILMRDEDPSTVAGLLVEAALKGGGEDNVTVVVIDAVADGGETGDEDLDRTVEYPREDVLLGPKERGGSGGGRRGRGRRSGSGARGNLRGRVAPFLRPPGRPAEGDSVGPSEVDAGTALGERKASGVMAATTVMSAAEAAETGGQETGEPEPAEPAPAESEAEKAETPSGSPGPGESSLPRKRGKGRRKWIVVALVVVAVLVVAVIGVAVFASTVYYVGTSEGAVALYRGLPVSILGVALSYVIEPGTVPYDALPSYLQARVDSHELVSKEEGQLFLRSLGALR